MNHLRKAAWLAALGVIALCMVGFARTRASLSYTPYKLFEMALWSDTIVYGRIKALQAKTFDLECERMIVGGKMPSVLRVERYVDWTCASRWTEYAVGQRVLLFLGKPDASTPYPWILSGGGEGEMPLVGEDIILRGYSVRGCDYGLHETGAGVVRGTRIPLAEFCAAIEGLRDVLRDELLPTWNDEVEHFVSPAVSESKLLAYVRTSMCAQHLVESASSDEHWKGPLPPMDVRLDPKKLREIQFADQTDRSIAGLLSLARNAASVGDLDGDGNGDLVVDTPEYDEPKQRARQLRVLFLDAARNVRAHQTLLVKHGSAGDWDYCSSLAAIGDLDGNGTLDLVTGNSDWDRPEAPSAPAAEQRGAMWLHFLGPRGSVENSIDIGSSPMLAQLGVIAGAGLGSSFAPLGDLDGDGTLELAIGQAPASDYAEEHNGGLILLSLRRDGLIARAARIADDAQGKRSYSYDFGAQLARPGDIDGDGIEDLAVSDPSDNAGGYSRGAVWIFFLNRSGTARSAQKISDWEGGFEGLLHDSSEFGCSLASAGDLDGNGVPDLLVGSNEGLWTLMLDKAGRVRSHRKLEQTKREDVSVAFQRSLCVLPGVEPDGARDFFCGGSAGLWQPNQYRFWALRVGRDGAVRER